MADLQALLEKLSGSKAGQTAGALLKGGSVDHLDWPDYAKTTVRQTQAYLPPPANPATPSAGWNQGVRDTLHGMFVEPVQQAGKALRGQLTENEAQNFALEAAAGLIPMGRGLKAAKGGIRAYHASPFEFERFDVSKVGTGEGRWYPEYVGAQGHGMYFTSSPDAAEAYRTMLKEEALVRKGVPGRDAKVYEVNLAVKPDELFDLSNKLSADPRSKALAKEFGLKPSATGKKLYDVAGSFPGKPFDPQLATDVLKDAGFKGTKYVDEPGKPQNYVVFDDKMIDILRKYGIAGAGLTGVLGSGFASKDALAAE